MKMPVDAPSAVTLAISSLLAGVATDAQAWTGPIKQAREALDLPTSQPLLGDSLQFATLYRLTTRDGGGYAAHHSHSSHASHASHASHSSGSGGGWSVPSTPSQPRVWSDPYAVSSAAAQPAQPVTPAAPADDLLAKVTADIRCSTFLRLLDAAGLRSELQSPHVVTVLAPANASFSATYVDWLVALEQRPQLVRFVLSHLVSGSVSSNSLTMNKSVKVIAGMNVPFTKDDQGRSCIGEGHFLATDIRSTNGVLHVMDQPIVPIPQATTAAESPGK